MTDQRERHRSMLAPAVSIDSNDGIAEVAEPSAACFTETDAAAARSGPARWPEASEFPRGHHPPRRIARPRCSSCGGLAIHGHGCLPCCIPAFLPSYSIRTTPSATIQYFFFSMRPTYNTVLHISRSTPTWRLRNGSLSASKR